MDLLANMERRLMAGQYEDAVIRAYRIKELIGQAQLFMKGCSSDSVSVDDDLMVKFVEMLKMDDRYPPEKILNKSKKYIYRLPREMVAKFLDLLDEPVACDLLSHSPLDIKKRNKSILIHGFKSAGFADHDVLTREYEHLENIAKMVVPRFEQEFDKAKYMNRFDK